MKKSIKNRNDKKQLHGYQEWYNSIGKMTYRGNWKNKKIIGYNEYHFYKLTGYFII